MHDQLNVILSKSLKGGFLAVQVFLNATHLAIVMEYASGGELFHRICTAGRFTEDEVINFIEDYEHIHDFLCLAS